MKNVEPNSIPSEFFIAQSMSFSDAFPTISIQKKDWGLIFEWPNSKHLTTNFALVNNESIDIQELPKWLKEDPTRKIFISEGIELPGETIKIDEIGIYYRKQKKISSPILDTETVKSYSYRTITYDHNLKEIMNMIAEMSEIPEESVFEFHRLIGGNLHLNEGEIWTLDDDGAILSTALTVQQTEYKNIKLIELLATRKAVRRNGHAENLLKSIIAKGKKYGFIVVAKKNIIQQKLLEKFDFELTNSFNVLTLK